MSSRIVPQRGFNLDYLMWLFTRISGLSLILLALVGIIGAFIMGARTDMDLGTLMRWTFFPNSFHVANSNIPDLDVWATAYWKVMQGLVVFFGATHGMNGLRTVLEDYLGYSFWRPLLRGAIFLLWLFLLIVAFYVIQAS